MLPRLALITDGRENQGSVARAAWQAQQAGVPIDTFVMQGRPEPALRLESVSVPGNAFTGEPIAIDLSVSSPAAAQVEIELTAEGRSLGKSQVELAAGVNPVQMHANLNTPGALDLSIALRPIGGASTSELRYDQAVMLKRPKLLYVSQDPENIDAHLTGALQSAQFEVTRVTGLDSVAFSDYQSVVLNNWDLEHIADARKSDLEKYVREGGGLLIIGGEQNVYVDHSADKNKVEDALDRTLPAKLLPPRNNEGVVVVLIIDKSSSMEGPKMDLAKAAATGTVSNLRPMDQVGVLVFDNSFAWVVPIRKADDRFAINSRIAGIFANGGTQIAPALTEAYTRVLPIEAPYRHILLLTDGISEEGNSYELSRTAVQHHVSISTIGLGADVHKEYLQKVADMAGGKAYFLREPAGLEQIVLRDVMEHTGTTAVESALKAEVAKETEILDGVDFAAAPALKGYVRFEAKPAADTILRIDHRDPLLARWQYGLGRAAVFTSDAKTRWAADWVTWKGFDKFWTNVVRDLLPHASEGDATAEYDTANGAIDVEYRLGPGVTEPATIPAIFALGTDGFQKPVEVKKTAAGTYRGRVTIGARQGLFRIRPLDDSRAFPEVGPLPSRSGAHRIRFQSTAPQASRRLHRRPFRAGGQRLVRSRQPLAHHQSFAVARPARAGRRAEPRRAADAQVERPFPPRPLSSSTLSPRPTRTASMSMSGRRETHPPLHRSSAPTGTITRGVMSQGNRLFAATNALLRHPEPLLLYRAKSRDLAPQSLQRASAAGTHQRNHPPIFFQYRYTISTGSPTTFEYDPSIRLTNFDASPWMAYAPALSIGSPLATYSSISASLISANCTRVSA